MIKKIIKKFLIILILVIAIVFVYFFVGKANPVESTEWGVTFSPKPIKDFQMDWQEVFLALLDDLGVRNFRIVAYWDLVEPEEGEYCFDDLDWQLDEIEKRGGKVVFVVGRRVPRWPECFEPEWIKNFTEEEKQEKLLSLVTETINRYKDRDIIEHWQVENEPFLRTFGECPCLDRDFLEQEIALVKELDPSRKIIITESGEFSTWIGGARRADIVGTSIYRRIYGKLGYVTYPIPPIFYQRKTALIDLFFDIDKIIAIEVQAEPWGHKANQDMTLEEQDRTMSIEHFKEVVEYTMKAGFDEGYLWGAEYWYWRKEKFGDDSHWEFAKSLF